MLYQKARAYDELGRTDEAMRVMEQLIAEHPRSRYLDEVQFRRAEHFFIRRKYRDAEGAYAGDRRHGPGSEYYELALYKLGWSLYKQEFYEEALHRYFALLDYKVASGYDFDAKHEEEEERRVEDTFQVISLSLSNLGGPEVIGEYFAANGNRSYEDRVYRYFGEFYLDEAPLQRRRNGLQVIRRAVPASRRRAALQHARDRDLRARRLPEAGARLEEGVRHPLRPAERSTGVTSTSANRRRS